jgi:broad specificity phosphatase PhoE
MEISLLRHPETIANQQRVFQGRRDWPLSATGEGQLQALSARLEGRRFDLVVASPLGRAMSTAERFATEVDIDSRWSELDVGGWEGQAIEEVRNDSDFAAWRMGEDIRAGGSGERFSELRTRVWQALDEICARIGDSGSALVVTHGGAIQAVVGELLGRTAVGLVGNTALTTLTRRYNRIRLRRFNDLTHLGALSPGADEARMRGATVVSLIRHARTRANLEEVWQGHTCSGLDEVGFTQAGRLGASFPPPERLYSSPSLRARQTASAFMGREPAIVDDLMEIGMGNWEGLTTEAIKSSDPELFERIFDGGEDLRRGHSGESWAEMSMRVVAAMSGLAFLEGAVNAVVSHGGAIRAYLASLSGGGWEAATSLDTPANTGISHVMWTAAGPKVIDYSLTPHLPDPG